MKSLAVIRTHFSPYHGPQFEQIERDRLEKLPGIKVVPLDQIDPNIPSVLITNTHTVLKDLPASLLMQTKLILHSNSGYDHMKAEYDLWKNIPVLVGHEIRAQAVAEYSLSCLFQGLVDLPQHLRWSKDRTWERPQIKDQNIWIYGFGHIGKIVYETLKSLGAKVTVIDPFALPVTEVGSHANANVIIVCSSLNKTSKHMFNEKFFKQAHPELIFINGARGRLVDEKALREFLMVHPKAQAFLDVFENEPFDESWVSFPQVWKTSHIAGVYSGLDEGIIQFEEKALKDFITMNEIDFAHKYQHELLQNKFIQGELI